MGSLIINEGILTSQKAEEIVKVCPFGAISNADGRLSISSACKMCKLCVKKSDGVIEYIEEEKKTVDKSQWKGICVYADHSKGKIHRVTYELCAKARELAEVTGHQVYALVIGSNVYEVSERLLHYGVDKVFVYDDEAFEEFRIEPYTEAFYDFIGRVKPSSVLVGATNLGRQLAPRIAARCRTGLTADCTVLEMKENTDLVQIRPAFGGNIMAQIVSTNTRPQFCTVRYKVFPEPKYQEAASGEIVEMQVSERMKESSVRILSSSDKPRGIDISEADVIVAVGRGCMTEALRNQAQELADLLGGMVACTRPLVESNIYDAKRQIGLSGRTVKPKFIICLGISGAVQFAAGMKSSETIVAVNSDKNASVFDIADYEIVGDVAEILPLLIEGVKQMKGE